jgi:hypothetical protein
MHICEEEARRRMPGKSLYLEVEADEGGVLEFYKSMGYIVDDKNTYVFERGVSEYLLGRWADSGNAYGVYWVFTELWRTSGVSAGIEFCDNASGTAQPEYTPYSGAR